VALSPSRTIAEIGVSAPAANDLTLQASYFYADGTEDVALMSLVGCPRPVEPAIGT
jgi:phosphoserine phosphatase